MLSVQSVAGLVQEASNVEIYPAQLFRRWVDTLGMTPSAPRTALAIAQHPVWEYLTLQYGRDCAALRTGPLSWSTAIRHLSPICEAAFESGGGIFQFGDSCPWQLIGRPSGAETLAGLRTATEQEHEAYLQWKRLAGFSPVPAEIGHQAWQAVQDFARHHGLRITASSDADYAEPSDSLTDSTAQSIGSQLVYLHCALQSFPHNVLRSGTLRGVALFSPRVGMRGAALFGCFEDGIANIYTGLCQGSRRFFLATLMHEMGHSIHTHYISDHSIVPVEARRNMRQWYRTIQQAHAFLGLDEGLAETAASRRARQGDNILEFLAEMHLLYTVAGDQLRAHIRHFLSGSAVRLAWDKIYHELRHRIYNGTEYSTA